MCQFDLHILPQSSFLLTKTRNVRRRLEISYNPVKTLRSLRRLLALKITLALAFPSVSQSPRFVSQFFPFECQSVSFVCRFCCFKSLFGCLVFLFRLLVSPSRCLQPLFRLLVSPFHWLLCLFEWLVRLLCCFKFPGRYSRLSNGSSNDRNRTSFGHTPLMPH